MEVSDATTKKPSIGKPGVHLHYHKNSEYRTLNQEQNDEWENGKPITQTPQSQEPRSPEMSHPRSLNHS